MNIRAYEYTDEGLAEFANQTREIFIKQMFKEDIVDEETANKMMQHSIVVSRPTQLGYIWKKLWNKTDNESKIFVVKVLNDLPEKFKK